MIFKYLGFLAAIFAKQPQNGIFKNDRVNENLPGLGLENFPGQPRFNESCDSDSQDAATECEERFLNNVS